MATRLKISTEPDSPGRGSSEAAHAYDAVGSAYRIYADGDVTRGLDFNGQYSFADREIWARLDETLIKLRVQGRQAIRIVDAGCGPGTWLIRLALRARDLGFSAIECRGIDISPEMISIARAAAATAGGPRIGLCFDVADIAEALREEDDSGCDLTVCLYGVLNHLAVDALDAAATELARITDGVLVVTVRTVGSLPTIYVQPLSEARRFHQDNIAGRLEVDLVDGRHIGFGSHLFSSAELRGLFQPHISVGELVGLDLFHGRFAPNPHWNPEGIPSNGFEAGLERLEHFCATDPAFMDRAAHILLVGKKRGTTDETSVG